MDGWSAFWWCSTMALGVVMFLRITGNALARVGVRLKSLERRKRRQIKDAKQSAASPQAAEAAGQAEEAA